MFLNGGHLSFNWGFRDLVLPFGGYAVLQSLTLKMLICLTAQDRKSMEGSGGEGVRRSPGSDKAASFVFTFLLAAQNCQGNGTELCEQEEGDKACGKPASFLHRNKAQTMTLPHHFSPIRQDTLISSLGLTFKCDYVWLKHC